jgi:cyanophycinase-like exopeptidase
MGTLTLIGSGELGPSMNKVHQAIARRLAGTVKPVFLDTPAGFEPNVQDIAIRATTYIEKHLGVPCEVASYAGSSATPAELEHTLGVLRIANYIFAGPGSPSYAVRCLRGSPVLDLMTQRLWDGGAHLIFSSAAAIAVSASTLPVYEIFKAGASLHWLDGVDLLGRIGVRLAIVPHWNNSEGGAYDTRCCFMGRDRFERLTSLLDDDVAVLGIDEHTACTIDLAQQDCTVMGSGAITVRCDGREEEFGAGSVCSLDVLRSRRAAAGEFPRRQSDPPPQDGARDRLVRRTARAREHAVAGARSAHTASLAFALAGAIEEGDDAGVDEETVAEGRAALADCVRAWSHMLGDDAGGETSQNAPLVDMLVAVRSRLRADGAWPLADTIRDGLSSLGIVLEDDSSGTAWRRRGA